MQQQDNTVPSVKVENRATAIRDMSKDGPEWLFKALVEVRINLPLFSTVFPLNSFCFCPVGFSYNNESPTGQKQKLFDGEIVESKGKLILIEIFPSVQKNDI